MIHTAFNQTSKPSSVLEQANTLQAQASNPAYNVWVSASAGSGKTKVLTDRILRLLLSGIAPRKILGITFTKNAAAGMQQRIDDILSFWGYGDHKLVANDLESRLKLWSMACDHKKIIEIQALARSLLAGSDKVRIQTIHSFCQSLLKAFPLEAKVDHNFTVIDERQQQDLVKQAITDVITKKQFELTVISQFMDEESFLSAIDDFLQEAPNPDETQVKTKLQQIYGIIDDSVSLEQLAAEFYDGTKQLDLKQLRQILIHGSKTEQKQGEHLTNWLQLPNKQEQLDMYLRVFLTQKGELRQKVITSKTSKQYPDMAQIMIEEQTRVHTFAQTRKALQAFMLNFNIYKIGTGIAEQFKFLKQQRAFLDYDDLIAKCADLLVNNSAAAWVMYKLDGGIDHILVDESQDTSPLQWRVITALINEFITSDKHKTFFIVGDEKQSIYSFQGASMECFHDSYKSLQQLCQNHKKTFKHIELNISFRSTPAVLKAVDHTFNSISWLDEPIKHLAARNHDYGRVELWDLVKSQDQQSESNSESNAAHILAFNSDFKGLSAQVIEAKRIADQIKHMLDHKIILPSKKHPITPGDIMILVQRRGNLMDKIIKYLQKAQIPVAGQDRILLTNNIAIQDLMALARFLCLPLDDFSLACALKSPLFNLNDDDLFDLTHKSTVSLWQSLQNNSKYTHICEQLKKWLNLVDYSRSYEIFSTILAQHSKSFTQTMGETIIEILDEFLRLVLESERYTSPNLESFIAWFEHYDNEVVRVTEKSTKVQIMTVHGAKGLQAPIVFLPDTTNVCSLKAKMWWETGIPLLNVNNNECPESLIPYKKTALQKLYREYLRLLYVAMTRAEDILIISGQEGRQSSQLQSWSQIINSSMEQYANRVLIKEMSHEVWRFSRNEELDLQVLEATINEPESKLEIPKWLNVNVAPEYSIDIITPSTMIDKSPKTKANAPNLAPFKGEIMHKLLEILPHYDRAQWPIIGQHIGKSYTQDSTIDINQFIAQANKIITQFPDIFSKGQAEVAVAAQLLFNGKQCQVQGRVDRVIIEGNIVKIIDFKTGEPKSIYTKQLELYRKVFAQTHPQYEIKSYLLWLDTLQLEIVGE